MKQENKKQETEKEEEQKEEAGKEKAEAEKKEKKQEKKEIIKKDKAIARGKNVGVSTKHSIAICDFIRNKKIDNIIEDLEKIMDKRKALPMKGEIPHRKGMTGGRYPMKACKEFIKLLKSLNANCNVNGIENPYIYTAKADIASRPHKRSGQGRFKRTNVYLEAREKKTKNQEKK